MGLRLGPEAPVVVTLVTDQAAHAGRHADHQRVILAAGLQQQNANRGVLGQTGGHDTAGGASSDDDIVVGVHGRTSQGRGVGCVLLTILPAPGKSPASAPLPVRRPLLGEGHRPLHKILRGKEGRDRRIAVLAPDRRLQGGFVQALEDRLF